MEILFPNDKFLRRKILSYNAQPPSTRKNFPWKRQYNPQ